MDKTFVQPNTYCRSRRFKAYRQCRLVVEVGTTSNPHFAILDISNVLLTFSVFEGAVMSGSSEVKRDDTGLMHLGLLGIVIGVLVVIWNLEHDMFAYQGLKWVWYQLSLFDWKYMPQFISRWRNEAAALASKPAAVSFEQLVAIVNKAGLFFVWIPLLMTFRGIKLATKHPSNSTRRKITAETLPWIMSRHSPAVIPSLYYGDLLNSDPEEQRSSMNPEEWVEQHGLLVNGKINRELCRTLLIVELGHPITSLDDLKPQEKAMFAVFGSRLLSEGKDLKKAQELLDDLNVSCHKHTHNGKKGYPNLALTDKAFKKYSSHPDASAWLRKHPYPRTLLHSMHRQALLTGKVPSSHFRWLKGMDRELWYALNTTGRKGPFQESSAVFTQALWEEFAFDQGYKLTEPFIDDAIDGIEKYLIKIGLMAPKATE
ncbi:conjugal transfer protein TrbA [Pseudomonas sp. AB12(2023)]|uniref:secretion/conjugation apparatus DotM-related subunit n=1 Tax=Pseudomonas sp. AB12(2023) TaxID=3048597 RepID=UPI002B222E13|nr:conjugal transfer protein TrbA [Pseudomonas sp. AB12(2023)]MEB0221366.1 conjugal transfer protein TrbA [Pseudomonas sp. AB12(2023)]